MWQTTSSAKRDENIFLNALSKLRHLLKRHGQVLTLRIRHVLLLLKAVSHREV
nr:hypothetical protein [Gammaproteobacteria bacterium]